MGMSVSLRVVFGVKVDSTDCPWYDEDEGEGDREDWWLKTSGFAPAFYPYDKEGNYAQGVTADDPRIECYYNEKREWLKANPIPFDIDYDQSYKSDTIFVYAPGQAVFWDSTELQKVIDSAKIDPAVEQRFREFLLQHFGDANPTWWAVPFYG